MISALAITYNEASNIERYIKSLAFADEIIIVDSYSTDNTEAIAKQHGVTFVKRKFDNFSAQKNYAISLAKNDWVVFFDLDEVIPNALAEEIQQKVKQNITEKAFKVKRNLYFMDKRIKYSGFQTDYSIRLFDKNYCKYGNSPVHETIETTEKIGVLKYAIEHQSYRGFDHYNQKLSHYSRLQAETLHKKNVRPNMYHFLFRPLYRFFHQYFVRLGILDGKEGFILSYVHAFSVFKRYIQLWTMYRKIK